MGTARAEDPLGKVVFFTKLAEAVPMESGVFCRNVVYHLFQSEWLRAKLRRLCRIIQQMCIKSQQSFSVDKGNFNAYIGNCQR